jgi:hypothetical protein
VVDSPATFAGGACVAAGANVVLAAADEEDDEDEDESPHTKSPHLSRLRDC